MSEVVWWLGYGAACYGVGYYFGRARGMTKAMTRLAEWLSTPLLREVREHIRAHE